MRYVMMLLSVIIAMLLAACDFGSGSGGRIVTTPAPGLPQFAVPTVPSGGYPSPSAAATGSAATQDGRKLSALSAVKIAQEAAYSNFAKDAQLYAIVPSAIMLGNLGNPPILPGWFYKFKVSGSRREYYVQIIDQTVSGTTVAEPVGDVKPEELPIDVSSVKLDSTQVLAQFGKVAPQRGIDTENVMFDLELLNPKGGAGPVWSVVNAKTSIWLYSVDAVSGAEVADPHQQQ